MKVGRIRTGRSKSGLIRFLKKHSAKEAPQIRVFLMDPKTGLGFVDEHCFRGHPGISKSGGLYVVRYGTSVDHIAMEKVGKITDMKKNVIYEAENFHMDLSVRNDADYEYPWAVYQGDVPKKRFTTEEEAVIFKDYLEGKRNRSW